MSRQELVIDKALDYVCAHCGRRVVDDSYNTWIHDVTLSVFCKDDKDGKWNIVKPIINNTKQKWVIDVVGYGTFFYEGTEEEAEEMRKHKANWEAAIARKRLADKQEIETGEINYCKKHPGYENKFDCDCIKCVKG